MVVALVLSFAIILWEALYLTLISFLFFCPVLSIYVLIFMSCVVYRANRLCG